MSNGSKKAQPREAVLVVEKARKALTRYIEDPQARQGDELEACDRLPAEVIGYLDQLCSRPDAYRDALLVALAIPGIRTAPTDIRERTSGGGRPAIELADC